MNTGEGEASNRLSKRQEGPWRTFRTRRRTSAVQVPPAIVDLPAGTTEEQRSGGERSTGGSSRDYCQLGGARSRRARRVSHGPMISRAGGSRACAIRLVGGQSEKHEAPIVRPWI